MFSVNGKLCARITGYNYVKSMQILKRLLINFFSEIEILVIKSGDYIMLVKLDKSQNGYDFIES